MPRQREVKPWTIYPPTQEDRDIIEQKAAEASLSVSAYLCMVGKLANIAVSLPTEQHVLSETQVIPTLNENPKEDDLGALFEKIEAEKEAEDVENPTELKPFAKILGCSVDEQEPTQKKPYILCDLSGNPLSQADSDYAHQERAAGRTSKIILSDDEDPYHTRQVFYCTSNNLKFEVVKEV